MTRALIPVLAMVLSAPALGAKQEKLSPSKAGDSALAEARKSWDALKKDAKRRRFHDPWVAVGQRFLSVAEKFPAATAAPEALLAAGELYAELSRISLAKRDLRQAVEAYRQLGTRYPHCSLADDAHLALGNIYRDRMGDPGAAETEFKAAAAARGDVLAKARKALASVEPLLRPKPEKLQKKLGTTSAVAKLESAQKKEPVAKRDEVAKKDDEAGEDEADEGEGGALTLSTGDDGEDDEQAGTTTIALPRNYDPARVKALKVASKTEVPLSVQVGLKVRRVIIDPGHGGNDDGAVGTAGIREKDVALSVAVKLKEKLEAKGLEVLLTRASDRFVSLEDRARFANKHKGDVFVSIHCNAYRDRSLRGTETYTLNVASDAYAMRLAARENASSEKTISDLQYILADLAARANTEDSRRLAQSVQSSLMSAQTDTKTGKPVVKDLGVKQALFYVLLGAKMPSVLVETAFLTNTLDEKRLGSDEGQEMFADSIAQGVLDFTAGRQAVARALTE